jgi:hypothetical protein
MQVVVSVFKIFFVAKRARGAKSTGPNLVPATNHLEPQVGKSCKHRFDKIGKGFPLQGMVKAGGMVGCLFSI